MTTTSAPPRPLLPVLTRMAAGLLLALMGALLAWQGIKFKPTPGLESTSTPLTVPLDGPLPLDLARAATLRFEGDRSSIDLRPLPARSSDLLRGEAQHRARNPVVVSSGRQGGNVNFTAQLYVRALDDRGVVVDRPEPFQHQLQAALTTTIPLTLSTYTVGGNQRLDLQTLRVRALTARSDSGDLRLTLPARAGGPYAVVTRRGNVTVKADAGAAPEAVRVNSQLGDLDLELGRTSLDALNVGSGSGNIKLILPARVNRGSLTTSSGNVDVTVLGRSSGNLDIRTGSGMVSLRLPRDLKARIRFTDRDTLMLPEGTPPATAPQLDIFVDASSDHFKLSLTSGDRP